MRKVTFICDRCPEESEILLPTGVGLHPDPIQGWDEFDRQLLCPKCVDWVRGALLAPIDSTGMDWYTSTTANPNLTVTTTETTTESGKQCTCCE